MRKQDFLWLPIAAGAAWLFYQMLKQSTIASRPPTSVQNAELKGGRTITLKPCGTFGGATYYCDPNYSGAYEEMLEEYGS